MSATYSREEARIKATQKAWVYRKYGRPVKFLDFDTWFNWTINKIRSQGAKVEIICKVVFITWPGQDVTAFCMVDFENDYEVYRKGRRATA